jgi:hypothetical protein
MNVVFDVNIVLDLLLQRREYYQEQERCFQLLLTNGVPLVFSGMRSANFAVCPFGGIEKTSEGRRH